MLSQRKGAVVTRSVAGQLVKHLVEAAHQLLVHAPPYVCHLSFLCLLPLFISDFFNILLQLLASVAIRDQLGDQLVNLLLLCLGILASNIIELIEAEFFVVGALGFGWLDRSFLPLEPLNHL